ncbi:right-handed parallel beta-helix repeat-containing protein [Longimicrobium sp.]|uniref:right-handed parallel beta-helix repeat-containing protein n=1 Tax=Longimicrobium sp. TaxID=2029185 RepID=UPI002C217FB6|nr:right-handed parallel beta-helix repeat-containing protein [Longimicrobium sp.]HSU15841.1 right-handed parallel beta-helix repeat-containing protein [Longimicrobium sp.]
MANSSILADMPGTTETETGQFTEASLYDPGEAWVNVRDPDYGATYDGSGAMTNAAAVIQAAINDASAAGGGTVLVPAGTYTLTAWVYVKSRVTVQGMPGSLIQNNGGGFRNGSFVTAVAAGADYDIAIRGLTIQDVSPNPATPPSDDPGIISLKFADRVRISENRIYQTGNNTHLYGVKIYAALRDSWITGNHHTLVGDFVYMMAGANDNVEISHNTVRGRRDLSSIPNGISLWGGAKNIRVLSNDVRGIGDEGISVQDCSNVLVEANTVFDCDSSCIDVRGTNHNVTIAGNNVAYSNEGQGCIRVGAFVVNGSLGVPVGVSVTGNTVDATPSVSGGPGIRIEGAEDVCVSGNDVYGTTGTGSGIVVQSTYNTARNVVVSANTVRNLIVGIEIHGCRGCAVDNNVVSGCAGSGIRTYSTAPVRLDITHNKCSRNGRTAAFSSGIEVNVGDRVRIMGNRCWDDQATPTQAFAILVNSAVTNAQIVDNDVSQGGLLIAPWNHANAPVLVRDNRGYTTRARNSVTVPAGATTLSVAHGLNRDIESVNNVRITPRSNLGGLDYWVTDPTPGDGAFTINLSAAAPAGGASFSYEAWSDRMTAY